jgi:cephalosporin hydroxylase
MIETLWSYGFSAVESALTALRRAGRGCLRPRAGLRNGGQRFVPFRDRAYGTDFAVTAQFFGKVQGAKESSVGGPSSMHWRGVPMKKDPFDLALYPLLLWELRPATIIELGAYRGGSALWMADLLELFRIEGRVYSYDIDVDRICARHERVTFARADSNDLGSFDIERLRSLPHPWLVLEDTHCNIYELLKFFDGFLATGDYVVVEDTIDARFHRQLRRFALEAGDRYMVDTRYADMFGYNVTWNVNGFLRRN